MEKEFLKQAKSKAAKFCAYQERTQQQVRDKLYKLGLYSDDVENILSELISEGFINEERYAKAYAGGKFRLKKWGRNKIRYELQRKGITDYCINSGLSEIDEDDYREVLSELVERNNSKWQDLPNFERSVKVTRYLISRGFEVDLIKNILEY